MIISHSSLYIIESVVWIMTLICIAYTECEMRRRKTVKANILGKYENFHSIGIIEQGGIQIQMGPVF